MRRLEFRNVDALPRLAWCARIRHDDPTVVVEHGPWVETSPTAFVEGAWNGAFAAQDFANAEIVLGSGGTLVDSGIAFTTTTHTMERLHSIRTRDALFVSNSFSYLLAATLMRVDPAYRLYEYDFLTFLSGYDHARRKIRTDQGRAVHLHYNETFFVDRDLRIRATKPRLPPSFADFDEYTGYLATTLNALHANATAAQRRVTYAPLATISAGYDSPACTVLAKTMGCTRAITFHDARQQYIGAPPRDFDDSGATIARYLGVHVDGFSREAYLQRGDCPEAEFLACGNGGDDVVMSALEPVLPRAFLVTGFLGDTLWGISGQPPRRSRYYVYRFPAGGSLGEFRIRVGFIHVPVPLLTFVRHAELNAITRSAEMAPWAVGGDYDRPIPRRIVEECGVPREVYAREKKAITQPLWITPAIEPLMSKHSYAELRAYCDAHQVRWHRRVIANASAVRILARYGMSRLLDRLERTRLSRAVWALGRFYPYLFEIRLADRVARTLLSSSVTCMKFHWAVERVMARYRPSKFCTSMAGRDARAPQRARDNLAEPMEAR